MKQLTSEYYEIRLESIGGLGANLCGKLLGELGAIYLGLNASSFSSYGSEKRGSPVKAYIRWCPAEKELRINSPVQKPNLLGIFHEAMMHGRRSGLSDMRALSAAHRTRRCMRQSLGAHLPAHLDHRCPCTRLA